MTHEELRDYVDKFDAAGDGMFLFTYNASNSTDSSIIHMREITVNRDLSTAKGLVVMGLLFVTLMFAFLFCYMAVNMDSDRQLFKIFFLVLTLIIVLYDLGLTQISLREYVKNDALTALNDKFFFAITWIVYIFIFLVALDLVLTSIHYLKESYKRKQMGDENYEEALRFT